jgi:Mrp family chromosome partitioning ATPase
MSIGFLLPEPDDAVIWRGPLKMSIIKQFLKDVDWGELDYLLIDSPPGTGDEPLSICQLIPDADGAIIVTTPQEVALADVRKSISFCRTVAMPVLGVIENMSGFVCPKCGEVTDIFKSGGGKQMALEMDVAFLGSIPIDARVVEASDAGRPCVDELAGTGAAAAFERAIRPIVELDGEVERVGLHRTDSSQKGEEVCA